jgi:hypothetical protein
VPDVVCVVLVGCHEKLLDVISRLPHLPFEITLGSSNVFLIRVIGLLVVVIFITVGGNYDPLGAPLRPPLAAFGTPLNAFAGGLRVAPWLLPGTASPSAWLKMVCQVMMSNNSFVVFG